MDTHTLTQDWSRDVEHMDFCFSRFFPAPSDSIRRPFKALPRRRIGTDVIGERYILSVVSLPVTRLKSALVRMRIRVGMVHNSARPASRLLRCSNRKTFGKLHWIKIYSEQTTAPRSIATECSASEDNRRKREFLSDSVREGLREAARKLILNEHFSPGIT